MVSVSRSSEVDRVGEEKKERKKEEEHFDLESEVRTLTLIVKKLTSTASVPRPEYTLAELLNGDAC
jgi:hypothetical protein